MPSPSRVAYALLDRYQRTGAADDLRRALVQARLAIEAEPTAVSSHTALGNALLAEYRRERAPEPLAQAVAAYRVALGAAPDGDARRPAAAKNLGTALWESFRLDSSQRQTIEEAIALHESAVRDEPSADKLPGHRNNLAMALRERFRRYGDVSDLDAARDLLQSVLESTSETDRMHGAALTNLSILLWDQHVHQPDTAVLDEAVRLAERSILAAGTQAGDRRRLVNLLNVLRERAREATDDDAIDKLLALIEREDLETAARGDRLLAALVGAVTGNVATKRRDPSLAEQAVRWARQARDETPEASAEWIDRTSDLALALVNLATLQGRRTTPEADALYRSAAEAEGSPRASLVAARGWLWWAEQRGDWPQAAAAARSGLALIDRLTAEQAQRRHRLLWAGHARNLVARSTFALAQVADPAEAALLAERARAKVLVSTRPNGVDGKAQLRRIAAQRPVVYLASGPDRGLALAVTAAGASVVDLPEASTGTLRDAAEHHITGHDDRHADATGWRARLDDTLGWVGKSIVRPVLQELGAHDAVTIVPTGSHGLLPFNGAWWRHGGTRVYAIDRCAVSVVPAAAVVAPDHAPIEDIEPCSIDEMAASSLGLRIDAHGRAFVDAPDAGFLAEEGRRLSVEEIRELPLAGTPLVVLAACETTRIGRQLPDEAIGLSTAFLEAGVERVIGTQWAVPNTVETNLLLARFRDLIRSGTSPLHALTAAQRWLRDASNRSLEQDYPELMAPVRETVPASAQALWERSVRARHPYWWAGFVHIG